MQALFMRFRFDTSRSRLCCAEVGSEQCAESECRDAGFMLELRGPAVADGVSLNQRRLAFVPGREPCSTFVLGRSHQLDFWQGALSSKALESLSRRHFEVQARRDVSGGEAPAYSFFVRNLSDTNPVYVRPGHEESVEGLVAVLANSGEERHLSHRDDIVLNPGKDHVFWLTFHDYTKPSPLHNPAPAGESLRRPSESSVCGRLHRPSETPTECLRRRSETPANDHLRRPSEPEDSAEHPQRLSHADSSAAAIDQLHWPSQTPNSVSASDNLLRTPAGGCLHSPSEMDHLVPASEGLHRLGEHCMPVREHPHRSSETEDSRLAPNHLVAERCLRQRRQSETENPIAASAPLQRASEREHAAPTNAPMRRPSEREGSMLMASLHVPADSEDSRLSPHLRSPAVVEPFPKLEPDQSAGSCVEDALASNPFEQPLWRCAPALLPPVPLSPKDDEDEEEEEPYHRGSIVHFDDDDGDWDSFGDEFPLFRQFAAPVASPMAPIRDARGVREDRQRDSGASLQPAAAAAARQAWSSAAATRAFVDNRGCDAWQHPIWAPPSQPIARCGTGDAMFGTRKKKKKKKKKKKTVL
eukprot:NODE_3283_length_2060_cov_13.899638.p1 GENE.NODE_3283_length_2060_cov_13.899638~~NODE_3283_length_2060_cov_13.899638.p1  ORF type:complete len:643 (+),score=89.34 NODE_3283_length_2060_cov_13.899638:176-1930(+)